MTVAVARGDFSRFDLSLKLGELLPTLSRLEDGGAFGMTLAGFDEPLRLRGWESTQGPCHETGRHATYDGPCLAVGDDDHHFIAGRIRVCEKTGLIYQSEPYRDLIQVSEPDPGLLERLTSDPVSFDCDTLSDDAESIAEKIQASPESPDEAVVYLGPFRYVVLENGTILRRGLPALVSADHARLLVALRYAASTTLASPPAGNFLALYERYGPLFLVGRGAGNSATRIPDFPVLGNLSDSTRNRIRKMLSRGDDYFMLQGTDPASGGCCPLPAVGECNALVEAGILESWVSPLSPECPMTAYAVAGEIGKVRRDMPHFHRNDLVRRTLQGLLEGERA